MTANYPELRAQKVFFSFFLPVYQKITGLDRKSDIMPCCGFSFQHEKVKNLEKLKEKYQLDQLISNQKDISSLETTLLPNSDFKQFLKLTNWTRNLFPHGSPQEKPYSQKFNALELLSKPDPQGYLCGTASQTLIQALRSLGFYARRVELRFTPKDAHAVVEAWSESYQKWVVLDPDYNIYYTYNKIPQNAIELHRAWHENRISNIEVHLAGISPNNIYKFRNKESEKERLREIYKNKAWKDWDKIKNTHHDYRFSTKLLHYYSQLSYPLRTDWISRPLDWWHPEGNHVQNSLTFDIESMRQDEDFIIKTSNPDSFYKKPY